MKKSFVIDISIYPREKILQSIQDFQNFARIHFDGNELTVVSEKEEWIEQIFNEFINYVTLLINE